MNDSDQPHSQLSIALFQHTWQSPFVLRVNARQAIIFCQVFSFVARKQFSKW